MMLSRLFPRSGLGKVVQINRIQLALPTSNPFRRQFAEAAVNSSEKEVSRVVYKGGFDNVLRALKRVSIFSCACTVVGVPLLAATSNNPRMQGIQRWAVAFVVVAFGVTTTVALHIVAKPYVAKLSLDATGELMKIETMNMFGRTKITMLDFNKVVASDKPWATFSSSADPKLRFFVEEVPESYEDPKFRERLFSRIGRNAGVQGKKKRS